MDAIVMRVAVAVLLLALVGVAACGDSDPAVVPAPTATRDAEGRRDLGYAKVGRNGVQAVSLDEIVPGSASNWEIRIFGFLPKSVSAWIGTAEDSAGEPVELRGDRGTYRGAVGVPSKFPQDPVLWIEVVDLEGKKTTQPFALP